MVGTCNKKLERCKVDGLFSKGTAFSIIYIVCTQIRVQFIIHSYDYQMIMSIFHVINKYIYIIWNICLLCQFHPAPSKKLTVLIGPRIFWPTMSNFSFTLEKLGICQPKTQCSNRKKWWLQSQLCIEDLGVINQPQTTSGKNDDRCVGTRAFVSSSPRRRIAPSCPPSSDGSSNNPPANHFFKRRSSMEG